jgi:hypothetical protein
VAKERITNLNEVYYGKEPSYNEVPEHGTPEFDKMLAESMSWYSKNSTADARKTWFIDWLNEDFPGESNLVEKVHEREFTPCGMLARMYVRGFICDYIADKLVASFHELTRIQKAQIQAKVEAKTTVAKEKTVDPRLQSMISDLESRIDSYIESGYKEFFDMSEWLKNHSPSPSQAHDLRERFAVLLNELRESFTDEDLKEAYSHITLPQKKRFVEFVSGIVETRMQRKARKPRKRREVKVEKVLAKVKHLSHSPEFGVKSVNPDRVLGAEGVLTFNNKYRTVNYLVAEAGKKLEIKGTTIQNIDEKRSFAKRLRKPEQVLPVLLKNNLNTSVKTLNGLSTQAFEATGRLGNDTLILKVF